MAVATTTTIVDGHTYYPGDTIPDLGSLECINVDGLKREYRGLSIDFPKLPKYDDLGTGSSCLFLDTGEYAEYLKATKSWFMI